MCFSCGVFSSRSFISLNPLILSYPANHSQFLILSFLQFVSDFRFHWSYLPGMLSSQIWQSRWRSGHCHRRFVSKWWRIPVEWLFQSSVQLLSHRLWVVRLWVISQWQHHHYQSQNIWHQLHHRLRSSCLAWRRIHYRWHSIGRHVDIWLLQVPWSLKQCSGHYLCQ